VSRDTIKTNAGNCYLRIFDSNFSEYKVGLLFISWYRSLEGNFLRGTVSGSLSCLRRFWLDFWSPVALSTISESLSPLADVLHPALFVECLGPSVELILVEAWPGCVLAVPSFFFHPSSATRRWGCGNFFFSAIPSPFLFCLFPQV